VDVIGGKRLVCPVCSGSAGADGSPRLGFNPSFARC
jgi:hypothetical protein